MNCSICNDESVITPATRLCAVCNDPTCARPSGRSDNKFHGELCRYSGCHAFICELDTHDHSSTMVGHTPLPRSFPALSLAIAMGALSGAEFSLGHRPESPIAENANIALSRFLSFMHFEWRATAIADEPPAVSSYVRRKGGQPGGVRKMRDEYFDPERVAYLTLEAGFIVREAWGVFDRTARDSLREQFSGTVIERIAKFTSQDGGELLRLKRMGELLGALSPRLSAFVAEAEERPSFERRRKNVFDFTIQGMGSIFSPSDQVRSMAAQLGVKAPVAVLKA